MKFMSSIRHASSVMAVLLAWAFSAHAQQDSWAESYRQEVLGKYAEAQAAIEHLANKQHEFATLRSAWLLYLQGRHVDAERRYLRVAEANPRAMEAWLGMMLPQMAQYRWADAMKSGQKALEMNPWDYTAHVRMMVCEEAMSRWGDLATRAAALAMRYPSDATALVYAARAAAAQRDMRKARGLYAQVLERFTGHVEAKKFLSSNP